MLKLNTRSFQFYEFNECGLLLFYLDVIRELIMRDSNVFWMIVVGREMHYLAFDSWPSIHSELDFL